MDLNIEKPETLQIMAENQVTVIDAVDKMISALARIKQEVIHERQSIAEDILALCDMPMLCKILGHWDVQINLLYPERLKKQ